MIACGPMSRPFSRSGGASGELMMGFTVAHPGGGGRTRREFGSNGALPRHGHVLVGNLIFHARCGSCPRWAQVGPISAMEDPLSRRALITGITGQDGSYLAEHLLELGYEVW